MGLRFRWLALTGAGATWLAVLTMPPVAAEELRPAYSYFSVPNASSEVRVVFKERALSVSGVKTAGGLVWMTVWRERVDHAWTRVERALGFEADIDADGAVEVSFEKRIPTLSTWVIVGLDAQRLDVEDAKSFDAKRFDIVAPAPFTVRTMSVALRDTETSAPYFETRGSDLEVLWLRPGTGVWHARIRDGDPADRSAARRPIKDRKLHFEASAFEAVFPAKLDPPRSPEPGDILLAVEATSLRAFGAQVE